MAGAAPTAFWFNGGGPAGAVPCGGGLNGACGVAVKVEAIAVDVFHGELAQTPGLCLERLDDPCAPRGKFVVRGVDVRREHPVNGGLERARPPAEEDRDVVTRD